jgi:hypothetical protein
LAKLKNAAMVVTDICAVAFMNIIVAVIGWIFVAEGLLGIARPHLMLAAVSSWSPDLLLYVTVGGRIVFGLLLFFAAPSCRLPRFTRVIGVIAFISGIMWASFVGASRLESIVQWISAKPSGIIQLIYVLAVILGAFLVFSGSSKKRVV